MNEQPKYKTGDIVIVKTYDIGFGNVEVPAIIRYYDPMIHAYEASVFAVSHPEAPADQEDICWWGVSENEIACKVGEVKIEKPRERKLGEVTFHNIRF